MNNILLSIQCIDDPIVGEFQLVLNQIIEPLTDLPQFNLRKLLQLRFDLVDLAHAGIIQRSRRDFKRHDGPIEHNKVERAPGKSKTPEELLPMVQDMNLAEDWNLRCL